MCPRECPEGHTESSAGPYSACMSEAPNSHEGYHFMCTCRVLRLSAPGFLQLSKLRFRFPLPSFRLGSVVRYALKACIGTGSTAERAKNLPFSSLGLFLGMQISLKSTANYVKVKTSLPLPSPLISLASLNGCQRGRWSKLHWYPSLGRRKRGPAIDPCKICCHFNMARCGRCEGVFAPSLASVQFKSEHAK